MSENIIVGYNISTDPHFLDKENAITPELSRILERFHKLAFDGKESNVQKILDAIEKYPNNPQLKNYLSVLYGQIGDTKKMYETNRWIISEHPNYLFGKLNLANEYYFKKEYHKMPEILGDDMEIKALYPNRETFHLNEVTSFLKCAILYFTAIGDIEQAEIRYNILEKIAPESDDTDVALNHIFIARLEAGKKRFEEEKKNKISVKTKKQEIKTTMDAPKFANPEIEWLYSNGLYISEEKTNTLLSLPRALLISDLQLVLQDSIDRYAYFLDLIKEEEWKEEKMNFVIHAIFLLGELKSKESIESIFNVLKQSKDYFDLYLGDFLTSAIWEPIYKIANHNLDACKQLMFKPGIYSYARTVLPDMVEQIAHHQPDRRDEVIQWFKEVILFFLNSKLEDNVIDSDVVALLICNVINIEGKELMPEIEMLFDEGIVSIGICGDWRDVRKALQQPSKYDKKNDILTIAERYKKVTSSWASYIEDESDSSFDFMKNFKPSIAPIKAEPKIGRNDPCPCGSGRKYKKCCYDK